MPATESQGKPLHERTLRGIQDIVERILSHVDGIEKSLIIRGIQVLYPKLEQRILGASESELRSSLQYVQELIGKVLDDPPPTPPHKTNRTRKRKTPRRK